MVGRAERGIALLLVIVVLAALLLIATPFALSMKDQHSSAALFSSRARAALDARSARDHAVASLYATHPANDPTPGADGPDELAVPLDFAAAGLDVADPRGRIWSVRVEDEQGKINLNAASPHLIANLFAASELIDALGADDSVIPVAEPDRFDPRGGVVAIDGELIAYSRATARGLEVARRGHLGQDDWVFQLDVAGAWAMNAGSILRVTDGEKTQYGVVPRSQPGQVQLATGWSPPVPHEKGTPVLDGRAHAIVMGRVVREPGKLHTWPAPLAIREVAALGLPPFRPEELEAALPFLTVHSRREGAAIWSNPRELRSDADLPAGLFRGGAAVVEVLARAPVNVNTAPRRVREALIAHVKMNGQAATMDPGLPAALAGRIERRIAEQGPIAGKRDLIEGVLRPARDEELLDEPAFLALAQNFDDCHSQLLAFPTASLIYRSLDVYTLETAAAVNSAAGLSLAVDRLREVVSVNPQRALAFRLGSQRELEDHMLPGGSGRLVVTGPVNVESLFRGDPPPADPPVRLSKLLQGVFASEATEDEAGADAGDVRLRPARPHAGRRENPRAFVEHFDASLETEGRLLDRESLTIPLQPAQAGRPGAVPPPPAPPTGAPAAGGLQRMNPVVLSLWWKPLATAGKRLYVFGAGTGTGEHENKVECFYDNERKRFVLEVADGGLNDGGTVSQAWFPMPVAANTWYHVTAAVNGTRPSQMTLAIDGVPFRGAERMKHRFMTRLTADIGPEPTQLPVEDASGFPNSGTVLIDDELIDYSGRSQTGLRAFRRAARHTWVENESNQGTSWRGTAHKAGAAVELYGYANPLASDLPAGGGRTLPGAQGSWGEFSVAYPVAEDRFPVNVGNVPVLVEGLAANRTTLRIDANLLDGGGVAGFPSSGYALLVSRELRIPGATPQAPPLASFGGAELIAYDGISGGALTGVRRGASTRRLEGSGLDLRAKDHVRFVSAPGTPRYELPFAVVPVSAGAAAGGDWLDPMVTGFSERIQVEREWIRYDELIAGAAGGAMHFVRSDPTVFARVYGHVNGLRWYPAGGAPGGSGLAVPPQQPAPPPRQPGPNPIPVPEGGEWTHATLRNQLAGLVHYRGVDDTQVPNVGVAHAGGTEIVPVFRTEGYSAAAGDVVTVISGDGRFRERRRVQWAAREVTPLVQAEVPPRIVNRGGETRVALVALNGNVSRRIVSDVARMRAQDENVHLPSALGFDTRGVARILKAPSGEMPYTMEMQLTVGGTFGGRHTPCWVDEVGVAQTNLAQVWHRVVSPRQERPVPADAKELTLRRDSLWNGWGSEASQWRRREVPPAPGAPPPPPGGRPVLTRVLFETSKMRAADRGRPLVNLVKRANEPWVRARAIPGRSFASRPAGDDRDCGVIQVGTELIAYRGFEDRPAENLIVLKDLARGFFGTEAAPHYDGEEATFQAWMDLALLKGAVDGGAFAIPVENTFGFPPQGMLALLDARGQAAEVVSWTRIGGEGFEMPRGAGTGESDAAERGLFRGRFGTAPVAHEPGTIAYEMPFRYWDRAVEGADDPNLGYYQFPVEVGEAWFRSLTWSAKLLQPHLRLRVLARVDARSPWGAQPDGARGLFEFRQPRDEEHPNRIEMQGDLLEARVYFEYEPGAFRPDFTSDAWKETPVLESIAVDYYAPNRVLSSVK